jgi:hypothetical protein
MEKGRKKMAINQTYIGLDPGVKGGIVVIPSNARISGVVAHKMPPDATSIWQLIASLDNGEGCFCMIEAVHSGSFHGRTQGVKSAFTFGENYGHIVMAVVAAGIPFERVRPQKWQAIYGLKKRKGESDTDKKNRHKARAQELCPVLRMTHAIADAFLLAEYCRRLHEGGLSR